MNINNTMQTDVLDILFANRNKSYGAYMLRKNYNKRLSIALGIMLSVCLLFSIAYKLQASNQSRVASADLYTEITLVNKVKEKPLVTLPLTKPKPVEQPRIATLKFTVPKLVNEQVITPPPTQDEANNLKIDVTTRDGIATDYVTPPVEQGIDGNEQLVKKENYEGVFTVVQQEARFPGGPDAWKRFLEVTLRTNVPTDDGAPAGAYTVIVSFLVDTQGNISEVKADNDPGYGTAAEAVRAIQKARGWLPAMQNNHPVMYRQKQSITFVVTES